METITLILGIGLILLIVVVVYLVTKINNKKDNTDDKSMSLLQNQISLLTTQLTEKIDRTNKEINDRLSDQKNTLNVNLQQQFAVSQKSMKDYLENIKNVTQELTKLGETNKQIQGFAGQLQSLENILKNPKQRGILGEYFLETVLKNVLPPNSYQMQYKLGVNPDTGKDLIVDAAVFVKDKIIPIDSKFSLENYNKILEAKDPIERKNLEVDFKNDLKKRIEETSKYIKPELNTMDFAFMFIPSEGIYYDLLINTVGTVKLNTSDLISYAFAEKKVIIVSPTSFLAYLQTVMQGLRALQIEESAQKIILQVKLLQKDLNSFEDGFNKVGRGLGTTVNAFNSSFKAFTRVDKDLFKLTGEKIEINGETLEKPLTLGDSDLE